MSTKVCLIVVLMVTLVGHTSHLRAAQSTPRVMVYGLGNQSCGEWTVENQRSSVDARIMQSWLLGYVSGASVTLDGAARMSIAETDA